MQRMVSLWIVLAFSTFALPSLAQVIINEVFYDPVGDDTGKEWIELTNRGSTTVDMTGWCLYAVGSDGNKHYVFGTFALAPGQYVIVHWNADGTDTVTDLYTGTTDPKDNTPWSNLKNISGAVALWNTHSSHSKETLVDYMEYGAGGQRYEATAVSAGMWTEGDFVPGVVSGHSLEYDGSGDTGADWFDQASPTPGGDNSLPVTLTHFSARRQDGAVLLRWTTQTEVNNLGWYVYRATRPDGPFVRLKFVRGAGNSAFPLSYEFIDPTPLPGFNYYFIEDVDMLGQTERSDVVSVPPEGRLRLATLWARVKQR